MIDFNNKTILLTGGSSGIGKALVISLCKLNANIIVIGKRQEIPLEFVGESKINYHSIDLSDPNASDRIIELLHAPIDIFISNAGIAFNKNFQSTTEYEILQQLNVNLYSTIILTKKILSNKLLKVGGNMIYLSSLSGVYPMANLALYCTSKFGIEGFVRSIKLELKTRAKVTLVYPGITMTEFFDKANMNEFKEYLKKHPYAFHTPERVANEILEKIDRDIIVIGSDKIYLRFERFIPNKLKPTFLAFTSLFNHVF